MGTNKRPQKYMRDTARFEVHAASVAAADADRAVCRWPSSCACVVADDVGEGFCSRRTARACARGGAGGMSRCRRSRSRRLRSRGRDRGTFAFVGPWCAWRFCSVARAHGRSETWSSNRFREIAERRRGRHKHVARWHLRVWISKNCIHIGLARRTGSACSLSRPPWHQRSRSLQISAKPLESGSRASVGIDPSPHNLNCPYFAEHMRTLPKGKPHRVRTDFGRLRPMILPNSGKIWPNVLPNCSNPGQSRSKLNQSLVDAEASRKWPTSGLVLRETRPRSRPGFNRVRGDTARGGARQGWASAVPTELGPNSANSACLPCVFEGLVLERLRYMLSNDRSRTKAQILEKGRLSFAGIGHASA